MKKGKRLNKEEKTVFGLIWMKGKLQIISLKLGRLLNINMYDLRKALDKLHKKKWINKKSCGRNGLELSLRKKEIPRYVIKAAEENLPLYAEIETVIEKYCTT
ncbi:MAG: hypothetical protein ACOX6Z_03725 [Dethiobacteria bacterium]|jgi:hypothetical protein